MIEKISIKEKIGYSLGDGAANIAWRGTATFLTFFYMDVFGLDPVAVGLLMLVARSGDGVSDVLMGVIGDRTKSKYGKFRPWILWTAVPLALILSLLFTDFGFGDSGKLIYAYITYILFTLIYTANNIPYGALMAVMTGDNQERTAIGSFRMAGAFAGGMLVQGLLLYLVIFFGNVDPQIDIQNGTVANTYELSVSAPMDVQSAKIKTDDGIAKFIFLVDGVAQNDAKPEVSFKMEADKKYSFLASGVETLDVESIAVINQKVGYRNSIYLMSIFLALFMIITFASTKERVQPPKTQKLNLKKDLMDLFKNKPWLILIVVGLLFNIFNSMRQGITLVYFIHYVHNEILAASYFVALGLAAIIGALITAPLAMKFGKKRLFIYALLFSATANALVVFLGPNDIVGIFGLGIAAEFASAIFPTLFFAMLGDVADFSEWKEGRRATGLVYSAGSFVTKFGGGLAGAVIGFVLGAFGYNGLDVSTIPGAIPGIVMLMSWVPALVTALAALVMVIYPLNQEKMDEITEELSDRRKEEVEPVVQQEIAA
ncbi:MAG: MFS transporter [Reichenbachiella sp.]